jgi:hypothetical protein
MDTLPRMGAQATGQVMEFLTWAALIAQSRGALHVFLPVLDRGLDAVIHRRTDGEYIPVQVKCRTEAVNGFVEIGIPAHALVDDRALIIAGLLTREVSGPVLGPMVLVVDQATFKSVGARSLVHGEGVYTASFPMESTTSHWHPYLMPRDELAARLLGPGNLLAAEDISRDEIDDYASWLGSVGEQRVIEIVGQTNELSLFRPFPDLETVEVLVRNNINGRYLGLQVKTAVPDAQRHGEAHLQIRKASFVPAPSTYVVGLAWLSEQKQCADECLLVPSERLIDVAADSGEHWVLNFRPHSQERTRLDPYRRPLAELGQLAKDLLAEQ